MMWRYTDKDNNESDNDSNNESDDKGNDIKDEDIVNKNYNDNDGKT